MLRVPSFFDPDARADLLVRIEALRPGTPARWGRMSVQSMVVHLSESYRFALDATNGRAERRRLPVPVPLGRWVALRLPIPWPRGAPTIDRLRVDRSLRPADAFDRELAELRHQMERFARAEPDRSWPSHPLFGDLSREDWGRWAWRHADHHLRQFGA